MTFSAGRAFVIVGVIVVGAFSLVVDDVNTWLYPPPTIEHPNDAARRAGERSPQDRTADFGAADAAARPTGVVAQDQLPAASSRDNDAQPDSRFSRAVSLTQTAARLLDESLAEAARRETPANTEPLVDGGAADAVARASDLALQDHAAPADRQIAQADPNAGVSHETQADAVAHASAEDSAIGPVVIVERPVDGGSGDAAARMNDVVAAEQTATLRSQQPLDHAPAEVPGGDAVANFSAEVVDATVVDAAARKNDAEAADRTATLRDQHSEPDARSDVTAQAPSQPLDHAPAEAPGRDTVANVGAEVDAAAGAAAGSANGSAAEHTAALHDQHSEPDAQNDVTAQAPSQPRDGAPAEAPGRDAVANAGAEVDRAVADAATGTNDAEAAVQMAALDGQRSGSDAQKDMAARAPSQLLDDPAVEASSQDAVANVEVPIDGGTADAIARSEDLDNPIDHSLGRRVPLPAKRPTFAEGLEEPTTRTSSRRQARAARFASRRGTNAQEAMRTPQEHADGDLVVPARQTRDPRAIDGDAARRHGAFNELGDPRCVFSVRRRGRAVIYTARCPRDSRHFISEGGRFEHAQNVGLAGRGRVGSMVPASGLGSRATVGVGASGGFGSGGSGSVGAGASAGVDVGSVRAEVGDDAAGVSNSAGGSGDGEGRAR
jgi:hypothetical protein